MQISRFWRPDIWKTINRKQLSSFLNLHSISYPVMKIPVRSELVWGRLFSNLSQKLSLIITYKMHELPDKFYSKVHDFIRDNKILMCTFICIFPSGKAFEEHRFFNRTKLQDHLRWPTQCGKFSLIVF